MNKSELERHLEYYVNATGEMLRDARATEGMSCKHCDADAGLKHNDDCLLWPIINARSLFHREEFVADETDGPKIVVNFPKFKGDERE